MKRFSFSPFERNFNSSNGFHLLYHFARLELTDLLVAYISCPGDVVRWLQTPRLNAIYIRSLSQIYDDIHIIKRQKDFYLKTYSTKP